jgi:hypothetical protein
MNTPNCQAAMKELTNVHKAFTSFQSSQVDYKTQIHEALKEIKDSQGKLQNVSISGHDGGGEFSGFKSNINRNELQNIMSKYKDINEVSSLLLLGCYTGTQKEVIEWKSIFPKAKVIAGHDGSAPLADRPQGHQYIADILTKEKQLSKQAEEKKITGLRRS